MRVIKWTFYSLLAAIPFFLIGCGGNTNNNNPANGLTGATTGATTATTGLTA